MQYRQALVAISVTLMCLAGCSSGSEADYVAEPDLKCDLDLVSVEANRTIEHVGGLVTNDYVVRFAKSTRAGVVALVDTDPDRAFDQLHDTYGVAIVARDAQDDDPTTIRGFQQIRDIVADACGDAAQ